MKLVTYRERGGAHGADTVGILVGEMVIELGRAAPEYNASHPASAPLDGGGMLDLLRRWDVASHALPELVEWIGSQDRLRSALRPLADLELLAPVPRPTSMRDGYAFRQHVEAARRNRGVEMIPEFDQFPVFYFTNHQAVTGPGPVVVQDLHLDRLDFELEAAIVIGREGRNIPASKADEHIAGYMVMNDWSARALQMEEMKLSLGPAKGKDFATSIGPWLVTRDELADRRIAGDAGERFDLVMTTRVNGTEVSRGNLKDMTWTFAQIIERASYGVTLYPGDVIGSGTVGTGCFLELNGSKITDNWWLKDGDVVECEIERLGVLSNVVRVESERE